MGRTGLAAIVAGLLLAGCGSEVPPQSTVGIDADGCEALLGGPAMERLTGKQDGFRTGDEAGLTSCQALIASEIGSRVTVVRVPASDWTIGVLPTLQQAEQQESTGDLARDAEFAERVAAVSGAGVSDDEACEMFSYLAETVHSQPAGDNLLITTHPKGGLEVVNGQSCAGGMFTLLTIETAGTIEETDQVRAMIRDAIVELNPGEDISPV